MSAVAWCLLILTTLFCHVLFDKRKRSKLPLPPGPKKLPLVGNLFNIPSTRPWEVYQQWSREYSSDIIHLDVAGTSILLLLSMEATQDLFEKRSAIYSDRQRFPMLVELMGFGFGIGFMKYGEEWRSHRKLFHAALNVEAARQFHPQEREATHTFLRRVLNDPQGDVMQHFRHLTGALILDVTYGIKVLPLNDPYIQIAAKAMHGLSVASVPGAFLVDTIPVLKYIPEWVPGAGFKRKAREWRKDAQDLLERPFVETKKNVDADTALPSFTASCLHDLSNSKDLDKGTQELIIRATAASIYGAGSDTTLAALGTFVLAMLRNPDAQKTAQEEIDTVLGAGVLPEFSDAPALPYVSAVVKEVLRWGSIVPVAIPHYIAVEDEYRGYRIPADTIVIGNAWALLHDEEVYPDPHSFKPERFLLDGKLNPAVRDPATVAYGFGRRTCPGRHMANDTIWIAVVSILAAMNIQKAVDDAGNNIEPSYESSPHLISIPLPFTCSITPRSPHAAELIRATAAKDE